MIFIALRLRDLYPQAFVHIRPFEDFALQLSKRPLPAKLVAEYFIPQFVNQRDCLDIFLVIWIASALQTIAYCDFLLDIDRLSTDFEYRSTASRWFDSIGCSVDFSDCSSPTSGDNESAISAFERSAADAASAIRNGASSLVVTRTEIVENRLPSLSPLSRRVLSLVL